MKSGFTREDLENLLAMMVRDGYLSLQDGKYDLTDKGRDEYGKVVLERYDPIDCPCH